MILQYFSPLLSTGRRDRKNKFSMLSSRVIYMPRGSSGILHGHTIESVRVHFLMYKNACHTI